MITRSNSANSDGPRKAPFCPDRNTHTHAHSFEDCWCLLGALLLLSLHSPKVLPGHRAQVTKSEVAFCLWLVCTPVAFHGHGVVTEAAGRGGLETTERKQSQTSLQMTISHVLFGPVISEFQKPNLTIIFVRHQPHRILFMT